MSPLNAKSCPIPSATEIHHLWHGKGNSHSVQAQMVGRDIAPTHLQPGTRRKWVVSTTPHQLYLMEFPASTEEDALSIVPLQNVLVTLTSNDPRVCLSEDVGPNGNPCCNIPDPIRFHAGS